MNYHQSEILLTYTSPTEAQNNKMWQNSFDLNMKNKQQLIEGA